MPEKIIVELKEKEKDNYIHIKEFLQSALTGVGAIVRYNDSEKRLEIEGAARDAVEKLMEGRTNPRYQADTIWILSEEKEREEKGWKHKYEGLLNECNRLREEVSSLYQEKSKLEKEMQEKVELYALTEEECSKLEKEKAQWQGQLSELENKLEEKEKIIKDKEKEVLGKYLFNLDIFFEDYLNGEGNKINELVKIFEDYKQEKEDSLFKQIAKSYGVDIEKEKLPALIEETTKNWEETNDYKMMHEEYVKAMEEIKFLRSYQEGVKPEIPEHVLNDIIRQLEDKAEKRRRLIHSYETRKRDFDSKKAFCQEIKDKLKEIPAEKITEMELTYLVKGSERDLKVYLPLKGWMKDTFLGKLLTEPFPVPEDTDDKDSFITRDVRSIESLKRNLEEGESARRFNDFGLKVNLVWLIE